MNFNQFGMTNFIVSGVEDVEICIMSILYSHVCCRNQYVIQFLCVEITSRKMDVKRLWRPSTPLTMEFVMLNWLTFTTQTPHETCWLPKYLILQSYCYIGVVRCESICIVKKGDRILKSVYTYTPSRYHHLVALWGFT